MRGWSQRRRLSCVLALNVVMIAALVIVGVVAHSLGVLAAAGDFAADSVALVLGLIAVSIRDRSGGNRSSAATTVVACVNGAVLLVVTVVVIVEAVLRLRHGIHNVHGVPVMVVSIVSAVMMLGGAMILGFGSGAEDLHMRSVLLDTLGDGAAAGAVAVAGGVIALTHRFYWLDASLAAVIGVIIGLAASRLLTDAAREFRRPRPVDAR
jgi:cobalt-zinc-cadmium efflux system protein